MIDTDNFLDKLSNVDPKYKTEIGALEKEFNCKITCDIEKHNALQFTYYFDVDFGKKENFYAEIESGISNGTRINSADWGINTKPTSKTVEVMKDVVFNEEAFNAWYSGKEENRGFTKVKALIFFERYKPELLTLHKNQNYDNYVTGGGTNKTDDYYKSRKNELSELGVFWEYIYEDKEVDCNFI